MPLAAPARVAQQHGVMHAADINRRLENLIQLGTIASVDHAVARCQVTAGELLTAPLPWLTARAGDARTWWAPSVGEQVVLLSPGGDLARGMVLPAIYAEALPAPDHGERNHLTMYPDGAVIHYDADSHVLSATLPAGGKVQVAAPGGVDVTGDVTITGKLHVTDDVTLAAKASVTGDIDCGATVTANTDVIGGGIKLKTHTHTGVSSGSSVSGPPKP